MECNKDEAMKAKQNAESKLRSGDFIEAQKFALKAQQLYPELDNISQLLTVCDVHCSAQNKILGSENDWYGILQIERSADEATIKKQYRKLALSLHPDKNKFAGAEAAFKLICEAHRVLLDQTGRSVYDLKCRAAVRTSAQSAQGKPFVRKQNRTASNFPNGPSRYGAANIVPNTQQFTGPHPFENAEKTTFWTSCSNCGLGYQYSRIFVNKILLCQSCQLSFTAFDLGTRGMPHSQAGGCSKTQQKVVGRVNLKEDVRKPKPNLANGEKSGRIPKTNVGKPSVLGTSRNSTKKRKRNLVIESQESCESRDYVKQVDAEIQENGSNFSRQNFGSDSGQQLRRSSRQNKNISYNKKFKNNNFVSPVKKSKGSKLCRSGEEELQEAGVSSGHQRELKQKANSVEETMPNKKSKTKEYKAEGKEADILDCDDDNILNPKFEEYPEPDFSDFDKVREENLFSVNQIWAIYDTCDGMPRFYACIKKVLSPGFNLLITWLEPSPDDESEKAWCDVELPIACGKFIIGGSEETEDRLMFSHRICWMNGDGRHSFLVYPKVGETWAIFKDWDINWSSDPEKHNAHYQFEFVEVLTDFDDNIGIGVAYLGRVQGFVSLFQQTACHEVISFSIAPAQLYRFSHRIPSFKMTGEEGEGVPVGSFEFDPASLPASLYEVDDPDDVKMEMENLVTKPNGSTPKSAEGKDKPKKPESDPDRENLLSRRSASGSSTEMPIKNHVDACQCIDEKDGRKADERIKTPKKQTAVCATDALKLRRSPRDLGNKNDQLKAGQCKVQKEVDKHSVGKVKKQSSILKFMRSVSPSVTQSFNDSSFPSSVHKIAEAVCHDFKAERSRDKFESNQIWALYSDVDGMPKNYAQVKKIDLTPDFRLHVVLLEACSPPNALNQPVCCGTFKVKIGKTQVFAHSAFSHRPKAEDIGGNRFDIQPRKGEIWAVYKKGNLELAVADRHKGECDIVEILEDNVQNLKLVVLSRVNESNPLYRVPRSGRSRTGFMEIPRTELSRFSHQIPGFRLTGEKNIQLSGCWNLDPSAIPVAPPSATIIID